MEPCVQVNMIQTTGAARTAVAALLAVLAEALYAEGAVPRSGEDLFALAAGCRAKDTCDVVGNVRADTPVLLLARDGVGTCTVPAGASREESDEIGNSFQLTAVSLRDCPGFSFELAWLDGGKPRYVTLPRLTAPDAALDRRIERHIRARRSQWEGKGRTDGDSGVHPVRLAPSRPKIVRLPVDGARLVSFDNLSEAHDPTQYLWIRGKAHLLHPAAVLKRAFTLDDRVFLHFYFKCHIGCGWLGHIVFEVTSDGPTPVMFDDTGSA